MMKLLVRLIFVLVFVVQAYFPAAAQTPEGTWVSTPDSAFIEALSDAERKAIEASLAKGGWANDFVGWAKYIADPSYEFSAMGDGLFLAAQPTWSGKGWRNQCARQDLILQKLARDWAVIIDALAERAAQDGQTAPETGYDFGAAYVHGPDVFLLWRAMEDSHSLKSGDHNLYSAIGSYYFQTLIFAIEREPCEATEFELRIGGADYVEQVFKARMLQDLGKRLADIDKNPLLAAWPADMDRLWAVEEEYTNVTITTTPKFPESLKNMKAKRFFPFDQEWKHEHTPERAAELYNRTVDHIELPDIAPIIQDKQPKRIRVDGTLGLAPYLTYDYGPTSGKDRICSLLENTDVYLINAHESGIGLIIRLPNCHLRSLEIRDSDISLDLSGATVDKDVTITNSVMSGEINLNYLVARKVTLADLRPLRIERNEKAGVQDEKVGIYAGSARIADEFVVRDVSANELWAGKSEAKVFRITRSTFANEANFWGVNADTMFWSGSKAKKLTAWYSKWHQIQVSDDDNTDTRHPSEISDLELKFVTVDGHVYFGRSTIDEAIIWSLSANDVELSCLKIAKTISFEDSSIGSVLAWENDIGRLNLNRVRGNALLFQGTKIPQTSSEPEGDSTKPAPVETAANALTDAKGECLLTNRIKVLTLTDAHFDTARIGLPIEKQLYANGATIGSLIVPGNRAAFAPGADLNLRHSKIGSLVLTRKGLSPADGPRSLSIDGAELGRITLFDPAKDDGAMDLPDPDDKEAKDEEAPPTASPNGEQDVTALYFDELLPSLGVALKDGRYDRAQPSNYSGTTYGTLRHAALAEGYPELERKIAILQNDHYAAAIASQNPVRKVFYWLGYHINQYGYDNAQAVVILLVIWLLGALVLHADVIWWLVAKLAVWGLRLLHSPRADRIAIPASCPRPRVTGLFFSIDRTIPTLQLDNKFAQPGSENWFEQSSTRVARGLIALLYLQRLAAFIVIAFMVGGILNVFQ
ncbi:hypothetical protein [Paenirhodobacter sp. CAU 1674]|uniref:hypothetical protein n=1 Tax=Paenirhodobacter sp. CAU 1674 TaxID=3032596 RepID=UPI0023DB10A6|nr:hypothetical protein [Paenirhodobacter sp. CAU 1674]MDF2142917.1 hypothetical protein [Paenirhodobacter sp. CAU 1674]